jgi:diguanylate cyclase (GGDEF)-like protein/PAS domain S-box-containing protein
VSTSNPEPPLAALPDGLPLAALAFDAAPVALAVAGPDGQWVRVNQALCELLGYPAEHLLSTGYRTVTHPEDLGLDDEATAELLAEGRGPAVEKRYLRSDGRIVWTRVTATLLRDPDGAPLGAVVVTENLEEYRNRHAELSRLALHDPLTGVRNRAKLDEDIERALAARDRTGGVVAVFYLDVDGFKGINDTYGHGAGDLVLVVLSNRLRDALREEDTVARLGGDEFVLVAHLPSHQDAEETCARIRRVSSEPIVLAEITVHMSVSVGMAVVTSSGSAPAQAIATADAAMYAVKRRRRSDPGP